MPFDSDVALVGTGTAPLVAAYELLSQGKSVLLLNPDRDFFLEDSELPLEPVTLYPRPSLERLERCSPERALGELRPVFPGPLEQWVRSPPGGADYHDPAAPHVRHRDRLWVESHQPGSWELLEELYIEASDRGLKPQLLEGLQAARRFPGFSGSRSEHRGLLLPRSSDFDVERYRNGLLEFVRERLGPNRVVCSAAQIDIAPDGLRFHSEGVPRSALVGQATLVFWTPRLTPWVRAQAKKFEVSPDGPSGIRLWEQWSLISREPIDPQIIGVYGDMTLWAEVEGAPSSDIHRLAVLRPGPLLPDEGESALRTAAEVSGWANQGSFEALGALYHGFLQWERCSIRSMRPRALFEWPSPDPGPAKGSGIQVLTEEGGRPVSIVRGCDGPLVEVVRNARAACTGIPA